MHIAVFADNFLPQINGVVTATLQIIEGMAARGHRITVFCPYYRKVTYPEFAGDVRIVPIRSVPAPFYEGLKLAPPLHRKVLKVLQKDKPDVLHFHTPMPLGLQAVLLGKLLKIPVVGTFHTYFGHQEYLKHVKLDFKVVQRMAWDMSNFYYNRCAHVTTPSSVTKQELLDNGLKKSVSVISNGLEINKFSSKAEKKLRAKYLGNADKLLLFVGRVAHEKNIEQLLRAFSVVHVANPGVRLLVVGDGPQFKDCQKLQRKLKIQDFVTFTGSIPRSRIISDKIYALGDVFVSMSETETQGITMLEALASGTPCICVNEGGLKDFVKDGKNGVLVDSTVPLDFARAILRFLEDSERMESCTKAARDSIADHDMPLILDKWEQLYAKVAKDS